jgi:hypothetical protein
MVKHVLRRSDSEKRKRVRPPGGKMNNGYTLPAERLEQRERAFVVYRDMGPGRSFAALERELKSHHPDIAVSRPTIEKWSTAHQWAERIKQHEIAMRRPAAGGDRPCPVPSPEFDEVAKLTSAAHLASNKPLLCWPVAECCCEDSDLRMFTRLPRRASMVEDMRSWTEKGSADR